MGRGGEGWSGMVFVIRLLLLPRQGGREREHVELRNREFAEDMAKLKVKKPFS